MSNRSVHYNVYTLLKQKPKCYGLIFVSVLLLILFIQILVKQQIKSIATYQAIYYCDKTCVFQATVLYEDAKRMSTDCEFIYNKNSLEIDSIRFGDVEIWDNSAAVQTIQINVPKQKLYNKQTVDITMVFQKESIGKKIIEALKGGD